MKINNFGPSGVNPYKRQMNKLENTVKSANKAADKVEISTTAKEMQQVSQYTNARQEKVEKLKIQVENGTYKVNPKEVAKSLIDFYKK
ncbi:flagellar biosynthesis anti-sigma factor FlgM [Cytobacillus depressus]|uniref:Negative regulator of flagellin synthesis n=1 Tax=Cytobacillus depressus TaxID=1602942 RepID=A0A6L3V6I1_9BACI|nr:flagellar biosynthesis anti-sigma factor FlgM [Cytobacillus depressus]KAB2336854.1 flagellar biosynthesis anti-sigma factor FlgM [Cytobacillus depressus]